jgi:multidrug efflux pump
LSRSPCWGPMAVTIMAGLFVATFLTVLFLPALYALWFRKSLDDSIAKADADGKTDHEEAQAALAMAAE